MSIAKRILKKLAPILIDAAFDVLEQKLSGKKKDKKNDTVDFGLEKTWAAGDHEESIDDFEKRIRSAVRRDKIKDPSKIMGVTDEAPGNPNRKRFLPKEVEENDPRFEVLGVDAFRIPEDYKHEECLKKFGSDDSDWLSDETYKNHPGRLFPGRNYQVAAIVSSANVTFGDFEMLCRRLGTVMPGPQGFAVLWKYCWNEEVSMEPGKRAIVSPLFTDNVLMEGTNKYLTPQFALVNNDEGCGLEVSPVAISKKDQVGERILLLFCEERK